MTFAGVLLLAPGGLRFPDILLLNLSVNTSLVCVYRVNYIFKSKKYTTSTLLYYDLTLNIGGKYDFIC